MLLLATFIQVTLVYTLLLAYLGHQLASKVNLLRPLTFEKKLVGKAVLLGFVSALVMLSDYYIFAPQIPQVQASYSPPDSFSLIALLFSMLYGGILEEIMLRLFFLSLLVFILDLVFGKTKQGLEIPKAYYLIANLIAAIFFRTWTPTCNPGNLWLLECDAGTQKPCSQWSTGGVSLWLGLHQVGSSVCNDHACFDTSVLPRHSLYLHLLEETTWRIVAKQFLIFTDLQRLAVEIPLHGVTTHGSKHFGLFLTLHTFSDGGNAKVFCHGDDMLDYHPSLIIGGKVGKKPLVHLDDINLYILEHGKRGVS